MKTNALKIIMRVLGALGVFLLLMTLTFEGLPLLPNNTLNTFIIMDRQKSVEQLIIKDAMILTYRSSSNDRVQALSELQSALPYWEREQSGLVNSDPSAGVTPHLPGDVGLLLAQSQSDFAQMDTAARQILTRHAPVDPDQLSILLQHERGYYLNITQATNVFQDHIMGMSGIYFGIELSMGLLLMGIWIGFQLATRSLYRRLEKSQGASVEGKENEDQQGN